MPGISHLSANHMEEEQMALLQDFGKKYLDGDQPAWYFRVMESVMTVPAFKTNERNTLRPLGGETSAGKNISPGSNQAEEGRVTGLS